MKTKSYYLYKAGQISGPFEETKISEMKQTGAILEYAWIINDTNPEWLPTDEKPLENPFSSANAWANQPVLTACFLFMKKPFYGIVKHLHGFGLTLCLKSASFSLMGLEKDKIILLNLMDEQNQKFINKKMKLQAIERKREDIYLQFKWISEPISF